MSKWTKFVPAAMVVLFGLVASTIPSTTSTVSIPALALVSEVQPTMALSSARHTDPKQHKNEDPGFVRIAGGAALPAPQVSL